MTLSAAVWIVIALGAAALVATVLYAVEPTAKRMATGIICIGIAAAAGLLGTVLGLRAAYLATGNVAPAERAHHLAEGIGQAMNCTAVAILAVILWIPPFVIGSIRARRMDLPDDPPDA